MSQNGVVVKWEVPARMTWDEFASRMRDVGKFHRQFPFYVGDLLRAGELLFHEKASQAINDTGLAPETLSNYKYVAGKIAFDERNVQVPFSVYQDVCSLPRPERDRIVSGYLGGTMNRAEIRAYKNGAGSTMPNGVAMATEPVSASGNGIPTAKEQAKIDFSNAMLVCVKLMKYGDEENFKEGLDELIEKAMALKELL